MNTQVDTTECPSTSCLRSCLTSSLSAQSPAYSSPVLFISWLVCCKWLFKETVHDFLIAYLNCKIHQFSVNINLLFFFFFGKDMFIGNIHKII